MTQFWKVTVTLDAERPAEAMTFVFAGGGTARGIMRKYTAAFPSASTINVSPCDAWGRRWPATGPAACPTCGQPDSDDSPCDHQHTTDHYHRCITGRGAT